jgi:alkyl sulfatase BDS1-like metallo-beta-lactamase superfamily hydrolase
MTQTVSTETPKDASASVIAQHAATLKALPFSDTRDFDDAARGFRRRAGRSGALSPTLSLARKKPRRPSIRACGGSRAST